MKNTFVEIGQMPNITIPFPGSVAFHWYAIAIEGKPGKPNSNCQHKNIFAIIEYTKIKRMKSKRTAQWVQKTRIPCCSRMNCNFYFLFFLLLLSPPFRFALIFTMLIFPAFQLFIQCYLPSVSNANPFGRQNYLFIRILNLGIYCIVLPIHY